MDVVPSIILAKDALDETIGFIRRLDVLNRSNAERSLREEIEFSIRLKLTERAIEGLRTACAASDLTMVVIDPRTQSRHAVRATYCDQRSVADLEFASAFFFAGSNGPSRSLRTRCTSWSVLIGNGYTGLSSVNFAHG
jgi:hypothetical protein